MISYETVRKNSTLKEYLNEDEEDEDEIEEE